MAALGAYLCLMTTVTMLHPGTRRRSTTELCWASQALFLGLSSPNYEAAVITRYGSPDVIKILDAPKPAPGAGEVLIRVHATTVSRTDCGELRPRIIGRFIFGLRRPRRTIFGMDFAGVVEAVGAEVMSFKPGDRVFGMCPSRSNGAQAEYVCIPER